MSNKPNIPAWQRTQPSEPSSSPSPLTPATEQQQQESVQEKPSEEPSSQSEQEPVQEESKPEDESFSLLKQAAKFLEDPTIRDEPREKKVAFLQSKGVSAEDIEQLLDTEQETPVAPDLSQDGGRAWSTTPPTQPTSTPTPKPPLRELPPIVTYPEFLTPATKPPPLITASRLVTTAYVAGGLAATMYGLAKFIIAPMTQNLADSRHDFASHTKEQLDTLNSRLGEAVSEDPALKSKPRIADIVDDISEADSDPTELFHRDFGTQTTPSLSRRASLSNPSDKDQAVVTGHESRLKILTSHIRELEATRSNDYASSESLKTKISDLSSYLHDLSYQSQYYSSMGGIYGSNYGASKSGKDDQIEILKTDIRAVKGVFLSARNFFPAGNS